eukprot:1171961-Prorocentrum_minimum.AAC.3
MSRICHAPAEHYGGPAEVVLSPGQQERAVRGGQEEQRWGRGREPRRAQQAPPAARGDGVCAGVDLLRGQRLRVVVVLVIGHLHGHLRAPDVALLVPEAVAEVVPARAGGPSEEGVVVLVADVVASQRARLD